MQLRSTRLLTFVVIALSLLPAINSAQASDEFSYPELLVAPRASERLEMEAKDESSRRWTAYLPIQIPALVTLTAAFATSSNHSLSSDPDNRASLAGILVGGGWIATTGLMSALSHPYTSGLSDLGALPSKSPREQLVRERLAEEALEQAARMGRRLTWLSVLSNAGVSAYMLGNATNGSFGKVASGISIAAALTPFVFPLRAISVASDQQSYKKKIYAPIASGGIGIEPSTGRLAPTVNLSVLF